MTSTKRLLLHIQTSRISESSQQQHYNCDLDITTLIGTYSSCKIFMTSSKRLLLHIQMLLLTFQSLHSNNITNCDLDITTAIWTYSS